MNFNSVEIFFPVFAAALYTLSVIFVKLATIGNTLSPTSILVFNNVLMWVLFLPSLFSTDGISDMSLIWEPMLVGVFFAMGNLSTFLCAHKGEVSLMTPIMGIKILMVLVLSKLIIGLSLPHSIIIAALICCVAVFLMGFSKKALVSGKVLSTFILAIWACSSYAMCDVLIQNFSPNFSAMSMLCISNFILLLSSFPYLGRFVIDVRNADRRALLIGAVAAILMVGDSLLMFMAISGDVGAPLCNVLYNTRGIISVLMILVLGKKFVQLKELSNGSAFRRTLGSVMILGAVILVLI